jgi:hypothetical protein
VKFVLLFMLAPALAMAESPATAHQPVAEPEPPPVKFVMTHVEALEPQVVRICYLDDGTREIVLPPLSLPIATAPAEASQPQVIRILNADEGTREIVVKPKP